MPFTHKTPTAFGYKAQVSLADDGVTGLAPVEIYVVDELSADSFTVERQDEKEDARWPQSSMWQGAFQQQRVPRNQAPEYDVEAIFGHEVREVREKREAALSAYL